MLLVYGLQTFFSVALDYSRVLHILMALFALCLNW